MNLSNEEPGETDFSQFWTCIQFNDIVTSPFFDVKAFNIHFGEGLGEAFADWRHYTVSGSEISDSKKQAEMRLEIMQKQGLDPNIILAARKNAKIVPFESIDLDS